MRDPLQGQREAVNRGAIELIWPDKGKGCPVQPGQRFALRSCEIEVVVVWRVPARAGWTWRARFQRFYWEPRRWFLGRTTGYVQNPHHAIGVWDANGPEPEAVPPMELAA